MDQLQTRHPQIKLVRAWVRAFCTDVDIVLMDILFMEGRAILDRKLREEASRIPKAEIDKSLSVLKNCGLIERVDFEHKPAPDQGVAFSGIVWGLDMNVDK